MPGRLGHGDNVRRLIPEQVMALDASDAPMSSASGCVPVISTSSEFGSWSANGGHASGDGHPLAVSQSPSLPDTTSRALYRFLNSHASTDSVTRAIPLMS
jgi:hypothetical protein